jgi:hypothetical protein
MSRKKGWPHGCHRVLLEARNRGAAPAMSGIEIGQVALNNMLVTAVETRSRQ